MDISLAEKIRDGAVGVMPTDTIYGLVGNALSPTVTEKLYRLKNRPTEFPFIILISSWDDLTKLDVVITEKDRAILEKNWPGPISFILPCPNEKFAYLHRGKNTLAVRWPAAAHTAITNCELRITNGDMGTNTNLDPGLRWDDNAEYDLAELIKQTSPLIATSANLSGQPAASTIEEAKQYFNDQADFYLDGGSMESIPSTLVQLVDGQAEILRQGQAELISN